MKIIFRTKEFMNSNNQLNNNLWWLFHEFAEIGKRNSCDYVNVSKITDVEKMLDCLEVRYFTPYSPSDYQKNIIALEKEIRNLNTVTLKYFLQALIEIFGDKHDFCETMTDKFSTMISAMSRKSSTQIQALNITKRANQLLTRYGAPYRIENGMVVSVSNEVMYENVISVAFNLLDGLEWKAANQHFQEIYEEFSKDNFEQVVFLSGKCLEDVMKTCCRKVGINDAETLTGCTVRDRLFTYSAFDELPDKTKKKIMHDIELVLTVRNEKGGHGSSTPHNVQKYLAEYQINALSSLILLLVNIISAGD